MTVSVSRTDKGPGRQPQPWSRSRWFVALREAVIISAAALLYTLVRGLTDDRVQTAFGNAERVISFERDLGFFIEADLQHAILRNGLLIDGANAVYIAYWPTVLGALVWLLVRHPAVYPLYRNAMLVSGVLTLVVFAAFPLAPPRFLPEYGFIDTIAERSAGYRDFNASALVNEYAAMPSLHFGWVLLLAVAVVSLTRHRFVRVMAMAMPVLMFAAIVLTGNHYIIDGIGGGLIVLSGLGIAAALRRARQSATTTARSPDVFNGARRARSCGLAGSRFQRRAHHAGGRTGQGQR